MRRYAQHFEGPNKSRKELEVVERLLESMELAGEPAYRKAKSSGKGEDPQTASPSTADYETSHALCRFFLEHTGPALGAGSHQVLPFLVNMARLFERFVAEWLRAHLPEGLELQDQEDVPTGELWGLSFTIDMVLVRSRDRATYSGARYEVQAS